MRCVAFGAKKADGQGFDKSRQRYCGKRFAGKTVLTISGALFAHGLMSKYRTQIAGSNTELALLI